MRLLELIRPFRLIVQRRVSEEEQVSVEAFCRTEEQANARLATILSTIRDHRKRSNEEVVAATRAQLTALDTAIQGRGKVLEEVDTKIAERHAELRRLEEVVAKRREKLSTVRPVNGPA
jgi:vacuolar-type H+-ATPase subunit I/STV1